MAIAGRQRVKGDLLLKVRFFLKCDKKLIFDRVSHQFEIEMESHIDVMLEINRRQWFWHGVDCVQGGVSKNRRKSCKFETIF